MKPEIKEFVCNHIRKCLLMTSFILATIQIIVVMANVPPYDALMDWAVNFAPTWIVFIILACILVADWGQVRFKDTAKENPQRLTVLIVITILYLTVLITSGMLINALDNQQPVAKSFIPLTIGMILVVIVLFCKAIYACVKLRRNLTHTNAVQALNAENPSSLADDDDDV